MDQVKFYLRQAVKYRFWIAIGVANLLAMIAYFVGSGPVKVAAATQTKAIESAYKDVQQYASGSPANDQYKPIVDEKKAILTTDVNKTWEKLYAKQAPLLTWPEVVNASFTEWGRKYPESVDKALVQRTINNYIVDYPADVEEVYKTFKPFDPKDGSGVVLAPSKEALLRPAVFDESKLPTLGKIWAAKERLWIQRTLLEVVAAVNGSAKDWDGAIVKQINLLEVGNSLAQDQRSLAKGEVLEEAPDLYPPGEEPAADAAGSGAPEMGGPMGGRGMAMFMGAGASAGLGGAGGEGDKVFYIKPAVETTQYKILPVQMSVLVEQSRVQDLLVALENSPMSIQVMDIEILKPSQRVSKPEKGAQQDFGGMGYGGYTGGVMMGGRGMGMMGESMGGPGGGMMGRMGGMSGMEGMMSGMGGMGGAMGGAAPKGKAASTTRKTDRDKQAETAKKNQRQIQDPYYNIVEVVIYGQARFYNPPPKEEAPAIELGADPAAEAAKPQAEAMPAEAKPADEPKAETPKAEEPKADTPQAEVPKADAPKAEESKAEVPKVEEPKPTDPPKA